MEKNKAESVVSIDENNLDRECIKLPTQYLQAAFQSAEAKRDVAEGKSELSVVEADLNRAIRADPATYGIEKITESAINAAIATSKEYTKAKQALQEFEYYADLAQALVWALEHKKRSLTLLVELHGMSYFSKPKVSEAGREAVERMTQRKVRRSMDDE